MAKSVTTPAPATASVPELETALAALRSEQGQAQQRATGVVETWVTKTERRAIVTRTGQVEEVLIDTPTLVAERVGPIERLQARRRLPDLADQISLAEEALEQAKQDAAAAARAQRGRGIRAGEAELRRLLPPLLAEVEQVEQHMREFNQTLRRLDAAVGDPYFTTQASAAIFEPGQIVDTWCRFVQASFPIERR